MLVAALPTDAMLPAFPAMAEFFDTSETATQAVITVFMFGYALPHLLLGSASDRFGRRPIIVGGMVVYLLGAVVCLFAQDFQVLLLGRFVQGMGAAGPTIMSRAILRDLFSGTQLARYLSFAMVFFTAGPVLAPFIGVIIQELFGWRAIFVFLALVPIALIVMTHYFLPETLEHPDAQALQWKRILNNSWAFVSDARSYPIVIILGFAYGNLVSYLSISPVVYMHYFGMTEFGFASIFALIATVTFGAQYLNAYLLQRYSPAQLLYSALLFQCALLLVSTLLSLSGLIAIWSASLSFACFFVVFAFVMANGTALALEPHQKRAGLASSALGFLNLAAGTLLATALGRFVYGPLALFIGMSLFSIGSLAVFVIFRQRFL